MAKTLDNKNPGGRPPLYTSVDELEKIIDEYFDFCDNRIQRVYSAKSDGVIEIIDPAPYTMSGLARALDMSRDTLVEYSKKEKFSDTIKRARNRVHEDVERRLMEGKAQTGAIFNLKNNFGWKDKNETDLTSNGETLGVIDATRAEQLLRARRNRTDS